MHSSYKIHAWVCRRVTRKKKIINYCEVDQRNKRNVEMLGDEANVTDKTNTCLFCLEFRQLNVFVEDIKIQRTVLEERG